MPPKTSPTRSATPSPVKQKTVAASTAETRTSATGQTDKSGASDKQMKPSLTVNIKKDESPTNSTSPKSVKIHPETRVETYIANEPIETRKNDKNGGGNTNAPSDKGISEKDNGNNQKHVVSKTNKVAPYPIPVLVPAVSLETELASKMKECEMISFNNSVVLFKDKAQASTFELIKNGAESNPRSQVQVQWSAKPSSFAYIRIILGEPLDCILSYSIQHDNDKDIEKTRYGYLKSLLAQNLTLVITATSKTQRLVQAVASFETLCSKADLLDIPLPLSKATIEKYIKKNEKVVEKPSLLSRIERICSNSKAYAWMCKEKRSAPFDTSKMADFEGGDKPAHILKEFFFSPARRNYLVYSIISGVKVANSEIIAKESVPKSKSKNLTLSDFKKDWSIHDLLVKKIFSSFEPLHSRGATKLHSQASLFKSLPTSLVLREYFGEQWAFFFAFQEFCTEYSKRMLFAGLLMVAWSVFRYSIPGKNDAVSEATFGKLAGFLWIFDNASIPLYSIVMNLSAMLFLKFWKRRSHTIAFLWDVHKIPANHSDKRRDWQPSSTLEYSYVTGEMVAVESTRSRVRRTLMSMGMLLLVLIVVLGTIAIDVVFYSYVSNQTLLGTDVSPKYGIVGALGIIALISTILILIVKTAITPILALIIKTENPRKSTHFQIRYIALDFFFNCLSSYGFLLFMALVRPLMSMTTNNVSYLYGGLICQAQGAGTTCLQELAWLIILVVVIHETSMILISGLGYALKSARVRVFLKSSDINTEEDGLSQETISGNGAKSPSTVPATKTPESAAALTKTAQRHIKVYQLQSRPTSMALNVEYRNLTLHFGYLVLFSFAFPFGPLFSFISGHFQHRLNIKKYLRQFKRQWVLCTPTVSVLTPNGVLVPAAGESNLFDSVKQAWDNWLCFVVYLAIVINGLSIPYITNGFYWIALYVQEKGIVRSELNFIQAAFFFVYVFGHFVAGVAIYFGIPDIPKHVSIGKKAELYISERRRKATELKKAGGVVSTI